MYRTSSSTRVSDEFFFSNSSSSPPSSHQSFKPNTTTTTTTDHLPTYHPQSLVAKKERSRLRSAESAIHLIPLLLVLSAIILWFFSSPVDLLNKGDSIVARVEDLTNNGNASSSSGSTKNSLLSNLEQHFDPTNESVEQEPTRLMENNT
ncbi:hypothetical protein LguiA_015394 [Lonicera macranthoides]